MTYIINVVKDKMKDEHENFIKDTNVLNVLYIYTNGSEIKATSVQ